MKFSFKSNFIFIFLVLLLSLSLTSAVTVSLSLPMQKQGQPIIISQFCTNSTYSNISSILVGGTKALGQTVMPEIFNDYYEYKFTNTTTTGSYIVSGYCDEYGTGIIYSWSYGFEVGTDGSLIFLLVGLAIVILAFAFVARNEYLGFMSGTLFLASGVYMMTNGYGLLNDSYTRMASYLLLGMGLFLMLASAYEAISSNSFSLIRNNDDGDSEE